MSRDVEGTSFHCEKLKKMAEQRHAVSISCRHRASTARTIADRIVYEEMARRFAEQAGALRKQLAIWKRRNA